MLSADESHHLARVLRASVGDEVLAFDGRGHEWQARITAIGRDQVTVSLLGRREPVAEPPVAVTLAIGLLKGDQMSGVVRDATMLGASAIVTFVSKHVAVPERAWRERSTGRWERIAVESAKQCGRAVVPAIHAVTTLDAVLAAEPGRRYCCVEPSARAAWPEAGHPDLRPETATVCVGPEGGWSNDDLECFRRHGTISIDLGPRTLRAETAPTVALSALWSRWGWR